MPEVEEEGGAPLGRPVGRIEVRISVVVNPSEDEARVRRAVLALFPDAVLEPGFHPLEGWTRLEGEASSLDAFAEVLARHRIRDAARAVMVRGARAGGGDLTTFHLNKQAALSGRVNFVDETVVLGPMTIEIRGPGLMRSIDEMTLHD